MSYKKIFNPCTQRLQYIFDNSTAKFGDVDSGNYAEFESDGSLVFYGEATTFNDFSVPLNRDKQGQSQKPDYDFTNLGLLFPQNDTSEKIYLVVQMPHTKKLDSDIYLHLHYIQSMVSKPTFKLDYRWYNNGAVVSGSWQTISTADGNKGIFTYSSGDLLQIATFPAISPPENEVISSNIDIIFYRDDNDVAGDILGKYLDFHYEINSLGSREQYSK